MIEPFAFDTVITGAGISLLEPSALPSGDGLAGYAWQSLFPEPEAADLRAICQGALPDAADLHEAKSGQPDAHEERSGLRLEHLLEVLGVSVDLRALVSVYRVMGDAEPNVNHYAFANLPTHQHFTLNMDTLLERALTDVRGATSTMPRDAPNTEYVHLHGRWDQPTTISTTLTQYLDQLPEDLKQRFVGAVEGRRVLAAGYSGRDFDVFPLLLEHPPRYLRWIVHPKYGLPIEVREALNHLALTSDCEVDTGQDDVTKFLRSFVDVEKVGRRLSKAEVSESGGRSKEHSVESRMTEEKSPQTSDKLARSVAERWTAVAAEVGAAFASTPISGRALGAARVLFELGDFERLLRLEAERPCVGADAVYLRKFRARVERRNNNNGRALRLLLRPPSSWGGVQIWLGNANEVALTLTRLGLPMPGLADRVLIAFAQDTDRGRRFRLQARVRLAQQATLTGDLAGARKELEAVLEDPRLPSIVGLAGQVEVITWLLDPIKAQGDFEAAARWLEKLDRLVSYSNTTQRAYAYWHMASVDLLSGDAATALSRLKYAERIATQASDPQVRSWFLGTYSDVLRATDVALARQVVDRALKVSPRTHYLARQFVLVEAAEQERVEGNLAEAVTYATLATSEKRPGIHEPQLKSMNYLAARMVALTAHYEMSDTGLDAPPADVLAEEATQLAQDYEQVGARVALADLTSLRHRHAAAGAGSTAEQGPRDGISSWQSADWEWRRPWHVIA